MDCIFCRVVKGEIPSYKVYEDDRTLAFLDINPIAVGHTLIIPKDHSAKISELGETEVVALSKTLQRVVKALEASIDFDGMNIFVNQGKEAGQLIPHFHYHVVPRHKGDGVEFKVTQKKLSEEEFKKIQEKISRAID